MHTKKIVLSSVLAVAFIAVALMAGGAVADNKGDRGSRGGGVLPVSEIYTEECSSCHFLYQAWLLPAGSWKIIMDNSAEHFGDDLALDEEVLGEILAYLEANSTENTTVRNKWTGPRGKIMRRLGGSTPESIGDIPYIRHEHDEFDKRVFDHPDIKSFSNCIACHRTADEGDYDEDNVNIPGRGRHD